MVCLEFIEHLQVQDQVTLDELIVILSCANKILAFDKQDKELFALEKW